MRSRAISSLHNSGDAWMFVQPPTSHVVGQRENPMDDVIFPRLGKCNHVKLMLSTPWLERSHHALGCQSPRRVEIASLVVGTFGCYIWEVHVTTWPYQNVR